MDMKAGSLEETEEIARQKHCLRRLNAAAWELEEIEGHGSLHPDANVANIEDWRKSDS